MKTDIHTICGLKIFMGSSTGNMLVDNDEVLERIFKNAKLLIATHCEDESTIKRNLNAAIDQYGDNIPWSMHPQIRSEEGCYLSSSKAITLAKETGARLHILHISTGKEVHLFDNQTPLKDKRITSEVCVHHLSFNDSHYEDKGSLIKCNPAIKSVSDQEQLWKGLLDDHLDIIATDHAPHTWEEKSGNYLSAPSGLPLVQHSLALMIDHYHKGRISPEGIVHKMCHAPAICFQIKERGYLREGYFADVIIADPNAEWTVDRSNILYKCGWSPLEGNELKGRNLTTIVSGNIVYHDEIFYPEHQGMRIAFDR